MIALFASAQSSLSNANDEDYKAVGNKAVGNQAVIATHSCRQQSTLISRSRHKIQYLFGLFRERYTEHICCSVYTDTRDESEPTKLGPLPVWTVTIRHLPGSLVLRRCYTTARIRVHLVRLAWCLRNHETKWALINSGFTIDAVLRSSDVVGQVHVFVL